LKQAIIFSLKRPEIIQPYSFFSVGNEKAAGISLAAFLLKGGDSMKLKRFLTEYGPQLAGKISNLLAPIYDPVSPPEGNDEFDEKIKGLLRQPFPVQAEIVKGLATALYREGKHRLFVCGEMGTGKTTIALSVAAISPAPQRTLVVCPTHLVEKWIREAKLVIPGVTVVDLAVKNAISVLNDFKHMRKKPETHEIYVISKERAKLGYGWRPAAFARGANKAPHCPSCGERAMAGDNYLTWDAMARKKCHCGCGERLWQADGKLKRHAPAEFIKKRLKGFFDLVVLDEIQDYKAGNSLQGKAMGSLLSASKQCLCLTGTLNGGYADDIFHLLYRTSPWEIKKAGFKHNESTKWLETYGTLERVTKIEEADAYYGRGKRKAMMVRKKPGVSPVVIGRHLLDKAAFVRLADVVEGLPPYEENVITVPLDAATGQKERYAELENTLKSAVKAHGTRTLSAMLQALLSYPDSCVYFPEHVLVRDGSGEVVDRISAPAIGAEGCLLPKESELVNLARKEKAEGRKVLCYLTFTGTRDIRPRLTEVLESAGLSVKSLDASVDPKKREAWIRKNSGGIDVLLVNAELVKTGLDLYEFPTVVFFQVGYNVFTLRQAARRSWRIGQDKPVRVYFLCYGKTMQEVALSLVAKKYEVALMVEGDLPEGLAEYTSTGESIIEEMGKALVDGGGYGGAEAAWANFRKKELEARLKMNGDAVFAEKPEHKTTSKPLEKESVNENVVILVTLMEGKKGKRQSTLEVRHADLDSTLDGKVAQFAMF